MICIYSTVLFFILSSFLNILSGQESLGLSEGRYVSTNALFLNPANSNSSNLSWDVQLISLHAFANSNYAHVTKTNAIDLLFNTDDIQIIQNPDEINESNDSYSVVFDQDGGSKFVSGLISIQGPSGYFSINENQKLGFFTELNVVGNEQYIPQGFGSYELWDDEDEIVYVGEKTQLNAMAWAEFGVHFSTSLEGISEETSIGTNVKYLMGFEGVSAQLNTDQSYYSLGDSLIGNGPGQAQLSFTNGNTSGEDLSINVNGHGLAVDFGINTKIGEDQIGLSILDLGFIHFGSQADQYTYSLDQFSLVEKSNYEDKDDFQGILDQLNSDLDNTYDQGFKMWLPLAISLQYDKKLLNNAYVGAVIVQRVPLKQNMLKRDNIVAITPRYETKWFSAMMPVSLYNYKKVHLGLAARFGFLTIGSDNVNSLWGERNFSGSDIYTSIRIFPFSLNREVKSGCEFN